MSETRDSCLAGADAGRSDERPVLTRRPLYAGLVLVSLLALGGCTEDPVKTSAGTRPGAVTASSATPGPSPTATVPRPTTPGPPFFTDRRIRALYREARVGSCLSYRPADKEQPVYYDRFPYVELVACRTARVTHIVVDRYAKYHACPPGHGRYTVDHPKMSHLTVMTLCLRPTVRPTPRLPPNIVPKR